MNTREIAAEYRLSHWAGIMRERSESGLSVRAFCKNAGFHENIYFYWQRKLREAAYLESSKEQDSLQASPTPVSFTEVRLPERAALPAPGDNLQDRVCVEAAGALITADSGYPIDKLSVLIQAVIRPC
jgi:hypothetical protein